MPCVKRWRKVAKEVVHIVNLEIGGKPLRKVDNVRNVTELFNITFTNERW